MSLSRLLCCIDKHSGLALVSGNKQVAYSELPSLIDDAMSWLAAHKVLSGTVIGIEMTQSFESVIMLLACWQRGVSTVLLNPENSGLSVYRPHKTVSFTLHRQLILNKPVDTIFETKLLGSLRGSAQPGFVIFSSGTTKQPKPVLHDVDAFIQNFRPAHKTTRMLAISALHTMSGFDALLYSLLSGSTLVFAPSTQTQSVCETIEKQSVQTLAVTPSFIRVLALSDASQHYNLTSVTILVLGAEPLDSHCLTIAQKKFPHARIVQKYGASEWGVLKAQSQQGDPCWLKVDNKNDPKKKQLRVLDGKLWLPKPPSLLCYLDDIPLIVDDGWLCTGDRVEVKGDWIKVLGRAASMINTGGSLVNPLEVESVMLALSTVSDVSVYAEPNPLLGEVVCADVVVDATIKDNKAAIKQLHDGCRASLTKVQRPVVIRLVSGLKVGPSYKKTRRVLTRAEQAST